MDRRQGMIETVAGRYREICRGRIGSQVKGMTAQYWLSLVPAVASFGGRLDGGLIVRMARVLASSSREGNP